MIVEGVSGNVHGHGLEHCVLKKIHMLITMQVKRLISLKYINTLHYQQGKMKIKVDFLSTELECDKKL